MLHKVREGHHQVVKHVGPHVDAGHNLLVDKGLLQLVGRLGRLFHGKLFDLRQLPRERLVLRRGRPLLLLPHQGGHVHRRPRLAWIRQRRRLDHLVPDQLPARLEGRRAEDARPEDVLQLLLVVEADVELLLRRRQLAQLGRRQARGEPGVGRQGGEAGHAGAARLHLHGRLDRLLRVGLHGGLLGPVAAGDAVARLDRLDAPLGRPVVLERGSLKFKSCN